jgi:hypothetical protein
MRQQPDDATASAVKAHSKKSFRMAKLAWGEMPRRRPASRTDATFAKIGT